MNEESMRELERRLRHDPNAEPEQRIRTFAEVLADQQERYGGVDITGLRRLYDREVRRLLHEEPLWRDPRWAHEEEMQHVRTRREMLDMWQARDADEETCWCGIRREHRPHADDWLQHVHAQPGWDRLIADNTGGTTDTDPQVVVEAGERAFREQVERYRQDIDRWARERETYAEWLARTRHEGQCTPPNTADTLGRIDAEVEAWERSADAMRWAPDLRDDNDTDAYGWPLPH